MLLEEISRGKQVMSFADFCALVEQRKSKQLADRYRKFGSTLFKLGFTWSWSENLKFPIGTFKHPTEQFPWTSPSVQMAWMRAGKPQWHNAQLLRPIGQGRYFNQQINLEDAAKYNEDFYRDWFKLDSDA